MENEIIKKHVDRILSELSEKRVEDQDKRKILSRAYNKIGRKMKKKNNVE